MFQTGDSAAFVWRFYVLSVKSYHDLLVWQKAMDLSEEVYRQIKKLPKDELFELVSQMRRAVVSVPSNIAEGQARGTAKEFINFLNIARGSNAEIQTQLLLCSRFGYLSEEDIHMSIALSNEVSKLLNLLIASLREKK